VGAGYWDSNLVQEKGTNDESVLVSEKEVKAEKKKVCEEESDEKRSVAGYFCGLSPNRKAANTFRKMIETNVGSAWHAGLQNMSKIFSFFTKKISANKKY
jgi:hypothetical protein